MRILESSLARRARRSPMLRPPAIAAFRLADRLRPASPGPRVVANSMPKAGTHLLATLLDHLDGMRFAGRLVVFDAADALEPDQRMRELDRCLRGLRDSHYVGAHLMHEAGVERRIRDSDAALVTILRDPRAVVVSGAHYVLEATQLRGRREALARFPDFDSILRGLVLGHGAPGDDMYFPEIGQRYARYAAWADTDAGLTVRFEDLVGSAGGGDDERQVEQVAAIVEHLGFRPADGIADPRDVAERIFSRDAITFRSGQVDSWRSELTGNLLGEVERRCETSMRSLGYLD